MEAFELFKRMLVSMNKEVISFLFKGEIPAQQAGEVQAARPAPRQQEARVQASKPELAGAGGAAAAGVLDEDTREAQKVQPVRVEQRIGRNDVCPCGSGKKYKNCHGQS